ncbi:hypothetical protein NDU88_003622 [Pleurodeles waltl]|uniref:Uncharacterized protein n=1 Tax=Pleurodeles waltl TaxID=8319 RepID=A0AAV7SGH1_PLEWA|nr:hypothetical protein NDU88_003622 [Pleurodeles waltl]
MPGRSFPRPPGTDLSHFDRASNVATVPLARMAARETSSPTPINSPEVAFRASGPGANAPAALLLARPLG